MSSVGASFFIIINVSLSAFLLVSVAGLPSCKSLGAHGRVRHEQYRRKFLFIIINVSRSSFFCWPVTAVVVVSVKRQDMVSVN